MSTWVERFNTYRNEEIHIPVPRVFKRGSVTKPTPVIYEIAPSLNHENKGIKTLVDSFNTLYNPSRVFQKEVVGLEIYANHERISYYFVLPEQYHRLLLPRIQNAFKGSGAYRLDRADDPASCFSKEKGSTTYGLTLSLKEPAFVPLSVAKDAQMHHDLVNILEHLEPGEQAFIQMLFKPAGDEWQKDFQHDYNSWLKGESVIRGMGPREWLIMILHGFIDGLQNLGRLLIRQDIPDKESRSSNPSIKAKLTRPGFKTSIRALVDAENYQRRNQLAHAITTSFRSLAGDNDFQAKQVLMKGMMIKQMQERVLPTIRVNNQILSSDEVGNLIKLPDKHTESQKLKRMTPEEKAVDDKVTEGGIHVGHTINSKEKKPVHFSTKHPDDTARVRLFVASPGGGKSTLIEQFVAEAARLGHGTAIFDVADGRLYERIIAMLPEYKDRIVCIDYTDTVNPPAINFSSLGGDDEERGLMFSEFFEVFFATQDLARTQSYLLKAALAVFSQSDTTLLEFIMMLRDPEYRKKLLPKIKRTHPDLYLWWNKEFPKISEARWNEAIAPIMTRLDGFLYNTKMRNLLCQKGGNLTPYQWMDEGKIVVFNMSNGTFTEPEQRVLMSLHNMMFWNATLAREKMTRKNIEPRPFHLIYDEPQTYMGATPMFDRAISKARKYRTSVNFFIQEAEQVINEAPDLWKKILGMSPHLMIGPVGESTAKHLSKELQMSVEEILAIKNHEYCWIMKTYVDKAAIKPFVMKALPPIDKRGIKIDLSHVEPVKAHWTQFFSKMTKKKLQDDITARNMGLTLTEYKQLLDSYTNEDEDESGQVNFG